ncbi:hypothetical protein CMV_025678 [Castanea mollissima]|uniref:Protein DETOXIFICATION n=1 Tax=Castanea mollissima TaxID=60419 RepID=A0A8J4QJJ0_9ROSI|nr:hypothetical protein CMV_025678 [Castanea mollissima]
MEREEEERKLSLGSPLIQISKEEDRFTISSSREGRITRKEVFEEVRKQLWLAGPLITVSLLQYSLQMISVMFVGHLGELALSGASMATSFATVTGFSLLMGMASALDTLCGQSYGAKQYHMMGIQMQRAMFVLFLVSIPLAIIWVNTRSLLILFGQEHDIATAAGEYACFMVPIFKSGLGYRGAALANAISNWINVLLLALYVKFSSSCVKTWTGFSKEAFHNIFTFLRLAIPSAVMVCLEMWSFEMMVLLSGLLPDPKLQTSVLSICLNTASIVWMIPFGLSGAVSTRVSNELGAGRPKIARLAVCVVLVVAITEGLLVGSVLILIRNIWGYAYSDEIQVVEYVAAMMPILAISNFLDGLQCVLSGNARGCGWQKIGAFINLGSYYIVGVPAAILLAFVFHLEGKGLWLGIICALVVQVSSLLTISIRTNWEQEAKKATERVHDSIIPVEIIS